MSDGNRKRDVATKVFRRTGDLVARGLKNVPGSSKLGVSSNDVQRDGLPPTFRTRSKNEAAMRFREKHKPSGKGGGLSSTRARVNAAPQFSLIGNVEFRELPFPDDQQLRSLLVTYVFTKEMEELLHVARVVRLDGGADANAGTDAGTDKKSKLPKESLLCLTVKRGDRVRIVHVTYSWHKGRLGIDESKRVEDLTFFDRDDAGGQAIIALHFGNKQAQQARYIVRTEQERVLFFYALLKAVHAHVADVRAVTPLELDELEVLAAEARPQLLLATSGGDQFLAPVGEGADGDGDGDGGGGGGTSGASTTELITEQEQVELRALMERYRERARADASAAGGGETEAMVRAMESDMEMYEQENVEAIIESLLDGRVQELAGDVATLGESVHAVRLWLSDYNVRLQAMQTHIAAIETENNRMEVSERNQRRLLKALGALIDKYTIESDVFTRRGTVSVDFESAEGVAAACEAAERLREIAAATTGDRDEPQWYAEMDAVKEQQQQLAAYRQRLSEEVSAYVVQLINARADALLEKSSGARARGGRLEGHGALHKALDPFSRLVRWLKAMDQKAYLLVRQAYVRSASHVYSRNLKVFCSDVRQDIVKEKRDHRWATFEKPKKLERRRGGGSNRTASEAFAFIANAVVPAVIAEQKFCSSFFDVPVVVPEDDEGQAGGELGHSAGGGGAFAAAHALPARYRRLQAMASNNKAVVGGAGAAAAAAAAAKSASRKSSSAEPLALPPSSTTAPAAPPKPTRYIDNEEHSSLLSLLLASLPAELQSATEHAATIDAFYVLEVLTECEKWMDRYTIGRAQKSPSPFVCTVMGEVQQGAVLLFTKFVDEQCSAIQREAKGGRQALSGVAPCVRCLPFFIDYVEEVLSRAGGSDSQRAAAPSKKAAALGAMSPRKSAAAAAADPSSALASHKLAKAVQSFVRKKGGECSLLDIMEKFDDDVERIEEEGGDFLEYVRAVCVKKKGKVWMLKPAASKPALPSKAGVHLEPVSESGGGGGGGDEAEDDNNFGVLDNLVTASYHKLVQALFAFASAGGAGDGGSGGGDGKGESAAKFLSRLEDLLYIAGELRERALLGVAEGSGARRSARLGALGQYVAQTRAQIDRTCAQLCMYELHKHFGGLVELVDNVREVLSRGVPEADVQYQGSSGLSQQRVAKVLQKGVTAQSVERAMARIAQSFDKAMSADTVSVFAMRAGGRELGDAGTEQRQSVRQAVWDEWVDRFCQWIDECNALIQRCYAGKGLAVTSAEARRLAAAASVALLGGE